MNNTGSQSGRSMVEMLGVIAIVGALSVGGIFAFVQAMNKNKSNVLLDGITHTVANFKSLFVNQGYFDELTTDEAYKLGVIPDSFKRDVDKITHSYGGEVRIKVRTNDEGQTYYAVAINGIPRDAAMSIATQDWGKNGDLVSVNLNDGKEDNSVGENTVQEEESQTQPEE